MKKFSFAQFNKERRFDFDVTPIIGKYIKSSELGQLIDKFGEDHIYVIRGLYLGKIKAEDSSSGEEQKTASVATDFSYINAPGFQYEEIASMIENEQAVAYINSGSAGFKVTPYEMRNKTFYKLTWVDIESGDEI